MYHTLNNIKMNTLTLALVLVLMSSLVTSHPLLHMARATHTVLDCESVCANPHEHDESVAAHCGCDPHSHRHPDIQAQKDPTTTLSLCDYLCSIQMGGAACSCSAPIVPGK